MTAIGPFASFAISEEYGRPSALTAKRIETTNLDALWADLASSDAAKAHPGDLRLP